MRQLLPRMLITRAISLATAILLVLHKSVKTYPFQRINARLLKVLHKALTRNSFKRLAALGRARAGVALYTTQALLKRGMLHACSTWTKAVRAIRQRLPKRLLAQPTVGHAKSVAPLAHSIALKRVGRLRCNWFLLGTSFGVGACLAVQLIMAPSQPVELAAQPQPAVAAAAPVPAATPAAIAPSAAPSTTASAAPSTPPATATTTRHEPVGDATAVKDLVIAVPDTTPDRAKINAATLKAAMAKSASKTGNYRGFGTIRSSLFQAGSDAGIPASIMHEVARAYSYDIDFQRDIHPGDTIEVFIERGKPAAATAKKQAIAKPAAPSQSLRYAALTLRGKKHEIFRYNNGLGLAWYDEAGRPVKKSLLATPIDAPRISSGFGMRDHPVLGYSKFHRGVDFAAGMGTPIMAAGDGTVEYKGWKSGYGNFVLIRHNGTYETAYGHISRFAGIKSGSKVKQGQVIAYVGMTGLATGPHLHYEVRMNDNQVNPTARQFNLASGLSGKQLAQFKSAKADVARQLVALAKTRQVASR